MSQSGKKSLNILLSKDLQTSHKFKQKDLFDFLNIIVFLFSLK